MAWGATVELDARRPSLWYLGTQWSVVPRPNNRAVAASNTSRKVAKRQRHGNKRGKIKDDHQITNENSHNHIITQQQTRFHQISFRNWSFLRRPDKRILHLAVPSLLSFADNNRTTPCDVVRMCCWSFSSSSTAPQELSPKFQTHLLKCSACSELVDDVMAIVDVARTLSNRSLPAGVKERLREHLKQEVDLRPPPKLYLVK